MIRNLPTVESGTIDLAAERAHSRLEEKQMLDAKRSVLSVAAMLVAAGASLLAQQPRTSQAFTHYVVQAEARIAGERDSTNTFLHMDSLTPSQRSEMTRRLHRGEAVIGKVGNTPDQVPGGLIHDWMGVVFIPGATVPQVVAFVRDYDRHARYYSPDVLQSRLISAKANDLHVFLRLRKQKVITAVLDTEYDVHYGQIDAAHQYSISRSTRVSEVADPGSANERDLPAGHDHGYMWRLNSYWAFEQANDGVYVQCEAISLTRDIPAALAWLVGPFVNSIPQESLHFTLNATRDGLAAHSGLAKKERSGSSF
jgi:hypothetical protein